MRLSYFAKKAAFAAWRESGCSDQQLMLAIESLTDAIETLRAMDGGGHFLVGLQLSLNSMESAMDWRVRRKLEYENCRPRLVARGKRL